MQDQLLTREEVVKKTRLSSATIYRQIKTGHFPSQVAIGVHGVRWRLSEVEAWMANLSSPPRAAA